MELFKLAGPTVILLDELVAYARQLPDDRFEALLSFVQSLTEAAKMAPGVLVVGSCLRATSRLAGTRASGAPPSPGGLRPGAFELAARRRRETYEIIRRRLFPAARRRRAKAHDKTIKAFHDLYKSNPAEFPAEARKRATLSF